MIWMEIRWELEDVIILLWRICQTVSGKLTFCFPISPVHKFGRYAAFYPLHAELRYISVISAPEERVCSHVDK